MAGSSKQAIFGESRACQGLDET
ncbi:hypothetical protein SIAM614_21245 [Stappia aggregata IAM 12614]|uniref:Uncharacterized protein n=1 Tax=Roseibium aggregatum (strain ATCC 25650 / DSM 13394 / JCM 20685 / NBRC 16684 / NCIMB 2208 / IAM 12614 / B1) TaxID=384765 RepID=A0P3E9_ROSAI|nr:hypothetical protein SIAM614_21245 [Stappia aggregata IAM 12614] [Roseibium aggregatum IAM 12614]